jgi:prepilin-type N-terminal cleavage/methylation domain-containing protein
VKRMNQRGFTVLELTLATAIFSIVLITVTMGIISFTKSYMRGVNQSKTQEAARSIVDELGQAIQFASTYDEGDPQAGWGQWRVFCVDNFRYSYRIDKKALDPTIPEQSHALIRSSYPGICEPDTDFQVSQGDAELLGSNMRLENVSIQEAGRQYTIRLKVLYGTDDLIEGGTCKTITGSQFCAVADLTSMVQRRL